MPAYSLEIRDHAKRLWESGNRPQEVRKTIRDRYSLKLSEATLRRWANDDSWSDWKPARQARTAAFTSSGDPTVHLCEVLARRAVREHSQIRRYGSLTKEDTRLITKDVLEHVIHNYEPDPIIINHLEGMIMDYIYAYGGNTSSTNDAESQTESNNQINNPKTSESMTLPSSNNPSVRFSDTADASENYSMTLSEGRRILRQLESKLVEIDEKLEQIKSMIILFGQPEKTMTNITQSTLDIDKDTMEIPEEYKPPTDDQIIQIYEEEERLQKLLEIWDESEEDTGNWTEKPWLGNS